MPLLKNLKKSDHEADFGPPPFQETIEPAGKKDGALEIGEKKEAESSFAKRGEFEKSDKKTPASLPKAPPPLLKPPPAKDKRLAEIEKIMEEDLGEVYFNLSPQNQIKFRAEGERVAGLIWQMVETAKIKVKKIVSLIRRWLKIIPGVNRYFLEQEAKIKTDKLLEMAKKFKKQT